MYQDHSKEELSSKNEVQFSRTSSALLYKLFDIVQHTATSTSNLLTSAHHTTHRPWWTALSTVLLNSTGGFIATSFPRDANSVSYGGFQRGHTKIAGGNNTVEN